MPEPTTERLAKALEEANDPRLAEMITQARAGYYDDFKSPIDTPCIQLVNDLKLLGYTDLAARAIDGEFDSTPEEAEEWFEKEGKHLFGHHHQVRRKKTKGFGGLCED